MKHIEAMRWSAICIAVATILLFAWNSLLGAGAEAVCVYRDVLFPTHGALSTAAISEFMALRARPYLVVHLSRALDSDTLVAVLCGITLLSFAGATWRPGFAWKAFSIALVMLAGVYTWAHLNANTLLMDAVITHVDASLGRGGITEAMKAMAIDALQHAVRIKFSLAAIAATSCLALILEPAVRWYRRRRAPRLEGTLSAETASDRDSG